MKPTHVVGAWAWLGMLVAAVQAIAPPFPVYPTLDDAATRHVLVVAEVIEQQYLPQFPECEGRDVICMDPPPTWLRARVLQRVHGEGPSVEFFAATTDHFGARLLPADGDAPSPRLMVLATDGQAIQMPRYASAVVRRDSRGDFHLVVHGDDTILWLPCDLGDLLEPIQDATLAREAALPLADHGEDHPWEPAFFAVDEAFAHPRFSIPVSKLGEWLQARADPGDLRCRTPGSDD